MASDKYADLRPAQRYVLERFADLNHDHVRDIGVELPTGEGKTLIALLIADWALDEGMSIAYLTGTKQLAVQVQSEAAALPGIDAHRFEAGRYPGAQVDDYHQAQAIGVMNYWVYFNASPKIEPADLIIFDDAHLAEQPLANLFTLRIPRTAGGGTDLYQNLCDLVLQQTPGAYPTLQALRDGTAPTSSPPELIAFNDWCAIAPSAIETIDHSSVVASRAPGFYAWQKIRTSVRQCGVLVGPAGIEIRPYHPPTQTVPGYSRSSIRIYLSATLGQPGDLQRRLGVRSVETIETPEKLRTASTGRRLFLINPYVNEPTEPDALQFALDQAQAARDDGPGRVAWLCASNHEADLLEIHLRERDFDTFRLGSGDDAELDTWRESTGGHLIAAGRFDGMDFPDEVCRLVVIPSVPAASTEFERFVVAYLSDATFMRHRVGQRITQALGRANRTKNDSAMYLGLDPGFTSTLAESAVRSSLGSDVQPVVRSALELHETGTERVLASASEFWKTHRTVAASDVKQAGSQRNRPGRTHRNPRADSSNDEVEAITCMWIGDLRQAAAHAGAAAESLASHHESEHSAFWSYVRAQALYLSGGDQAEQAASEALAQAVAAAPRTAWFVRLERTADELAGRTLTPTSNDALFLEWDQWIRDSRPEKLRNQIARAQGKLSGTHDERAEALEVLAALCGVTGSRPSGRSASDALWVWATPRKGHRRVWEIKTGTGPDSVPRDDVNQLLGQVKEEEKKYPTAKVIGCLLTVQETVSPDAAAAASADIALLHIDAAEALFGEMATRFTTYLATFGSGTAAERGAARVTVEKQLPSGDWLSRLLSPSNGKLIRNQAVLKIFRG
ncbi:helicase C-terminal domain-containing protein [Nocardia sp. NPDC058058]|uniref:helicase C-terminal domain-containing protein n=1 Tax=Nocardia sp. NPDC058058 TaxID=3346317 RepID=UPI0036DEA6E8